MERCRCSVGSIFQNLLCLKLLYQIGSDASTLKADGGNVYRTGKAAGEQRREQQHSPRRRVIRHRTGAAILQHGNVLPQPVQIPKIQGQVHIRFRHSTGCGADLQTGCPQRAEVKRVFLHRGGNTFQRDLRPPPQEESALGTNGNFVEIICAGMPAKRTNAQNQQGNQQVKPRTSSPVDKFLK